MVDSSKMGKLQRAFFAPVDAFKAIITEHGEAPLGDDMSSKRRDKNEWIKPD